MSYSLIGYDHTFDLTISYGVFSSIENVKKAIEELVLNHVTKISKSDYFIYNTSVFDGDVLMEEEQMFRKTLHIIKNGEMDKLIYPN